MGINKTNLIIIITQIKRFNQIKRKTSKRITGPAYTFPDRVYSYCAPWFPDRHFFVAHPKGKSVLGRRSST